MCSYLNLVTIISSVSRLRMLCEVGAHAIIYVKVSPRKTDVVHLGISNQKEALSDNPFNVLQEPFPEDPLASDSYIPPNNRSEALLDHSNSVPDPSISPVHQPGYPSVGFEEERLHEGIVTQSRSSPSLGSERPRDGSKCSYVETSARDSEVPRPVINNGHGVDSDHSSFESPLDPLSPGHESDGFVSMGLDFVPKSRRRKSSKKSRKAQGPKKQNPFLPVSND
ncbi:hypothetical protein Nepgr_033784 [Nepenthes gracilis]|uniref:Uncharacterized protein n=1 Tax=Nepenthes gracilis TaxID=150966 RepID=A0AAD3TL19_NEPGR|nr:hypothetical protein Nepgr_033784 [Nepenthes gracilis]